MSKEIKTPGLDRKESLFKRFSNAKKRKDTNWKNTYEEAFRYFSPQRNTFDNPTDGEKRTNNDIVFDSTGQDALQKAVSTVQANIFPPQKKFATLVLGPLLKDKQGDLAKKLEEISELFFTCLKNSNFDVQICEMIEDWLYGTGNLLFLKGTPTAPFNFVAAPINEVYLERGVDGTVGARFREWKVPNHLILETWPDAKLSAELTARVENNPQDETAIVECSYKAKIKTKVMSKGKNGKGAMKEQEVDGYRYTVQDAKTKEILVDRENKSHPWINPRYAVSAGEVYGRGPVLTALADNKTLNKTKELILKNAALAISGMWTVVDDGIINLENIVMEPGAKIPVMANPGNPNGPSIARLPSAADFNVAQIILEDLKKAIKAILFVDPLGEIDAPVKSATEIAYRAQSIAKLLGSAYGRMQCEAVAPIFIRGLYILEEFGMVNLNDFSIDGVNIAIQHVSPLAMAQDQEELTAITRYAEIVSGFFGPQGLMTMTNPTEFAKELARLLHVKEAILPTQEQMDAVKQLAGQALAAQMNPQGGGAPAPTPMA
jgi:hypothetical protein